MSIETDQGFWTTLVGGLAVALATITNGRIGKLETKIETKADKGVVDSKADKSEFERQGTNVNAIWKELRDLRQDMNDKHIDRWNHLDRADLSRFKHHCRYR